MNVYNFTLDYRLAADCHQLGVLDGAELLLMNNANFPWFLLVPHTDHTEFFELGRAEQQTLLASINALSVFLKHEFSSDKLNIATIGNIVKQLHIHIVGRNRDDVCWPGVVWGTKQRVDYTMPEVERIRVLLADQLGESFTADR
ncbi:MAG: HIT family protein [Gammaproteobacteria bacterium]